MTAEDARTMHILALTSVHKAFDQRIFFKECRSLAEAGYRVTLAAPAEFASQIRDGVEILGIPPPRSRWGRPRAWWRLLRLSLRLDPDAVHLHDAELLLLVPPLQLWRRRSARIVYDVHEYFIDSIAVKHWLPRWLRPGAAWLARCLELLLVRRLAGIVLAVDGQLSLYRRFRGPIVVSRNLPRVSLFEEAARHPVMEVDGLKLIYVGLILPQRGIGLLLEALRELQEQGVPGVHLFFIGPETSPAYSREIEAFAAHNNLADRVHWLGYVAPDDLKHYLVGADVGLVPMIRTGQYNRPSIPTKLFEYMLAGLPVLCADHPDWRRYVDEARCGMVVPAEDPAAYARAIRWFLEHPEEAREMGQRGKAVARDHYTWEQEQTRLLVFYRALLPGEGC